MDAESVNLHKRATEMAAAKAKEAKKIAKKATAEPAQKTYTWEELQAGADEEVEEQKEDTKVSHIKVAPTASKEDLKAKAQEEEESKMDKLGSALAGVKAQVGFKEDIPKVDDTVLEEDDDEEETSDEDEEEEEEETDENSDEAEVEEDATSDDDKTDTSDAKEEASDNDQEDEASDDDQDDDSEELE